MFLNQVQPSIVSLFSSTGSDPLGLFSVHCDHDLPSDSHVTIVNDDTNTLLDSDEKAPPIDLIVPEDNTPIIHPVLNIQSPTLPSTFIRTPPALSEHLGLKLPWLHIQVRNLGRPWSFEFGILDPAGRLGVIRCSTFQSEAILHPSNPPLLHLPLSFPPLPSTSKYNPTLTSWSTVSINIPSLITYFSSPSLLPSSEARLSLYPSRFASISYVQIYATCRLRRIWFSHSKDSEGVRGAWELELYGA